MFYFDTPIVPVSDDGLVAALPGFVEHHRVIELAGTGHWIPSEQPTALVAHLARHLAQA